FCRGVVYPAGVRLREVARRAQSRTVVPLGRSSPGMGFGVVGVPDGRIAPGSSAHIVAEDEHLAQPAGEFPAPCLHPHECPSSGRVKSLLMRTRASFAVTNSRAVLAGSGPKPGSQAGTSPPASRDSAST